ncbi:MAG TPA: hypothetical protein VIJ41_16100 [Candidatus Nanopelagicales bacterium]
MTLLVTTVAFGNDDQVRSLADQVSAFADAHLVVVDNSPADRRVTSLECLRPDSNVGYARGVNLAASSVDGWDHVLVVNPDVDLTVDPRVLAHHFVDLRVLAVCGRLTSAGGSAPTNLHPRPTLRRELLRAVVGWRAYRDPGPADEVRDVDQADGAWLLFSRAAWLRIGGFDERYELYFEDVEIADRIRECDGVIRYDPLEVGRHDAGSSARESGGLAHQVLGVSRTRYYRLSGITRHPAVLGRTSAVVELLARTVTWRPEGQRARWRALRLQWAESGRPGSVWLLGPPRPITRRLGVGPPPGPST